MGRAGERPFYRSGRHRYVYEGPQVYLCLGHADHVDAVDTQGPLYDFLATYGAGRELQRLEQIQAVGNVLMCSGYGNASYCLTSLCGPRGGPLPPPAAYEISGTYDSNLPAILLLSLMAASGGGPPYSIMDAYTWTSPAPVRA